MNVNPKVISCRDLNTYLNTVMVHSSNHTYIISFRNICLLASPITVMQTGHLSDSPSVDSEIPSTGAEGFAITPQDTSILKGYIEDFHNANTETRNKLLEKVMGELYSLWPPNSAFDKKEAKKVCFLKMHPWICSQTAYLSRKSGRGFTTTTITLTANSSSLLGGGQPGMPFIMRIRQTSQNLHKRCPVVLPDLRRSWVPFRMQLQAYGIRYLMRNGNSMKTLQRSGRRTDLQSIYKPSM
jgi:hypothetical protein